MASSSSSSHLIPTSWKYDVFMSFRGEDTRKNFVDHLYSALDQQGIYTYKDDETLARGESIGQSLVKAIQESRIAIIVFSKNYAGSSWCLDELAYIIECMDKRGQIVMPIFYDIDPSDVRKLKGKFEESFAKHELEHKNKVESWRSALVKAAKCIKDIVGRISGRLITNVNKHLIGIETRLQDLKSKLEIGPGGVRMVGIWGVGGGGKTTLASTAYTEISHQFEAHCLLENIRDESSKYGLKRLQEIFLSRLLKTNVVVESEIEGRSIIERRLCRKRVLVVLDDVDDVMQLDALAGSHDWFGEGSRIIITTRDEHLLTRHTDAIYEVSLLSHDEAIKLFSRHAYRKEKPVEDYEKLSQDVVSYAGGLPLALEILGSFLYDKDKDEWLSALVKLKSIPDVKVMERLKISYDGLELHEKELFLDIACFLRRRHVNEVMMVLDACSFHPGIGVKVLVQKSLINVSNGIFDMHDLIEEMAHYIVRGAYPNHPEKHSRIWKREDIIECCAMEAGTLMENEVLVLPSYVEHPRLPHVVANMKKLRWIDWDRYPASSFPSNFQPSKLGCLVLIRGQQKQLWKGCKHLPNLKILDLRYSKYLMKTPDFNGLPCLERLNLRGCEKLKEIHPSIGYHERLVLVDMTRCLNLKKFPPIIRMKKLEILKLSSCYQLQKFPDIHSNMDSLVSLQLDHTVIEVVPTSVGKFCTNLVSLDLHRCYKLKRIACNFHLLKRLEDINFFGCSQLQSQDSTSVMSRIRLQSFQQDSSANLKFAQFPHLLRRLNLSYCNLGDGDIPSGICELVSLQILDLSGNTFSRLHSSLLRIPCLKFLSLSQCTNLVEFPSLPSSIAILNAYNCDSLESIGDLSKYKWLWKVSLWNSNKLTEGGRVLHSMLQRNAIQDRFMSVTLPGRQHDIVSRTTTIITLQLPPNWQSEFIGFLVSCYNHRWNDECVVVIKQVMPMDSEPDHDHWEEFDKNPESFEHAQVGYVPFSSCKKRCNQKCCLVYRVNNLT
ncbi:putative TIR domain, P-loop containing nucleoside triphosphate hydrolase [Helianthus annuus]|nr:putative TIR domain, P-loop containing nucleoside triphosphate hydrolase [Helianthus annuus]KAJ0835726.1 putative TIR domain, P-loop containing nucleoside triphosphate hydrolase [Helianthus annuus]